MTTAMKTERTPDQQFHKWEDRGVGPAPYRFVEIFSFPSPGLAEANIAAYNNALAECGNIQRRHGVTGGACEVCGMPLTHNYIFKAANGHKFVVGCDCAGKAGELTTEAKEAAKREERRYAQLLFQAAEEKRAADWAAFCASQGWEHFVSIGEFRQASYDYTRKVRVQEQQKMASMAVDHNAWLIKVLQLSARTSEFCYAMVQSLQSKPLCSKEFSYRQLNAMRDIYAKSFGRRNSKAYNDAVDQFYNKLEEGDAQFQ